MQILCELVTVIREQKPKYHWETGKMADAMISSRETCLHVVQKLLLQATSNWLYVKIAIGLFYGRLLPLFVYIGLSHRLVIRLGGGLFYAY